MHTHTHTCVYVCIYISCAYQARTIVCVMHMSYGIGFTITEPSVLAVGGGGKAG